METASQYLMGANSQTLYNKAEEGMEDERFYYLVKG